MPNQIPNAFKRGFMRLEDNDAIFDTNKKIASVGKAYFGSDRRRHDKPAIVSHFDMIFHGGIFSNIGIS